MKKTMLALSTAGLLSLTSFAMASQHPDAQQRAALETALTKAGYVSWGEIELEHNYWDIEDARKELGSAQKFDVHLDLQTLEVIREQLDD